MKLPLPKTFLFAFYNFFLILLLAACASSNTNSTMSPETNLFILEESAISASAEVIPEWQATLSFPNGASNVILYVSPGTVVERGKVLASSDLSVLNLQLEQAETNLQKAEAVLLQLQNLPSSEAIAAAEAALANTEANFERLDRAAARQFELDAAQVQIDSAKTALVAAKKGASSEQLRIARSDVSLAKLSIDQVRAAIEAAEIRAPFKGTIIQMYANSYENLAPGQPVFLLADLSSLLLETTDLNEIDVVKIQTGDLAQITVDALSDLDLTGTVSKIALKTAPGSGVYYTVTIKFDQLPEQLRWGMSAFVEFPP